MKIVLGIFIACAMLVLLAPKAHAIIFLPALLLIPVAKIVALIIAGFSIPSFGLGVLGSKLFKKSTKHTVLIVIILLMLSTIVLALIVKMFYPDRPWF